MTDIFGYTSIPLHMRILAAILTIKMFTDIFAVLVFYANAGFMYIRTLTWWIDHFTRITKPSALIHICAGYNIVQMYQSFVHETIDKMIPYLLGAAFIATVVTNAVLVGMYGRMHTLIYVSLGLNGFIFHVIIMFLLRLAGMCDLMSIKFIDGWKKFERRNFRYGCVIRSLKPVRVQVGSLFSFRANSVMKFEDQLAINTMNVLLL